MLKCPNCMAKIKYEWPNIDWCISLDQPFYFNEVEVSVITFAEAEKIKNKRNKSIYKIGNFLVFYKSLKDDHKEAGMNRVQYQCQKCKKILPNSMKNELIAFSKKYCLYKKLANDPVS